MLPMMDPEEIKKEEERRFWTNAAASMGGGLAGAAIGGLSIRPMEAVQEARRVREAQREAELTLRDKQIFHKLSEIHRGARSWDSIPEADRPEMEHLYQEYQPILNDPADHFRLLYQRIPGRVRLFPSPMKQKLKQLLPTAEMIHHPMESLSHPAAAISGLIGAGLAGYAMNRHNDERLLGQMQQRSEDSARDS